MHICMRRICRTARAPNAHKHGSTVRAALPRLSTCHGLGEHQSLQRTSKYLPHGDAQLLEQPLRCHCLVIQTLVMECAHPVRQLNHLYTVQLTMYFVSESTIVATWNIGMVPHLTDRILPTLPRGIWPQGTPTSSRAGSRKASTFLCCARGGAMQCSYAATCL